MRKVLVSTFIVRMDVWLHVHLYCTLYTVHCTLYTVHKDHCTAVHNTYLYGEGGGAGQLDVHLVSSVEGGGE